MSMNLGMNIHHVLNYSTADLIKSEDEVTRAVPYNYTRATRRAVRCKVESPSPPTSPFKLGYSELDNATRLSAKSLARASCLWCHKVEYKRKLKRGVTFVVGRPRQGWAERGLPLLYTCCSCYEQGRKGRNLDHKMETLKAQYTAFDEYGIRFYECKKRVGDSWIQWIATSEQVWQELYNAYYTEQSFEGIKAFPILDLEAFGRQKGKSHLRNKREVLEDSSDVSLRLSASSDESSLTRTPEHDDSGLLWAAEALTELSQIYTDITPV